MRRGLTLIEVVVATALLAIVVVASLPFFQSAAGVFAARERGAEATVLLGAAVSRLVVSQEWERRQKSETMTFAWPAEIERRDDDGRSTESSAIQVTFPTLPGAGATPEGDQATEKESTGERAASTDDASTAPQESRPNHFREAERLIGDWVPFRSGDSVVYRWVARPPPPEGKPGPRQAPQ